MFLTILYSLVCTARSVNILFMHFTYIWLQKWSSSAGNESSREMFHPNVGDITQPLSRGIFLHRAATAPSWFAALLPECPISQSPQKYQSMGINLHLSLARETLWESFVYVQFSCEKLIFLIRPSTLGGDWL